MQSADPIRLGRFSGLQLSAGLSAVVAFIAVWLLLFAVALWLLGMPMLTALLASLAAAVLHWVAVLLHQAGHAIAARSTGYPMSGIRFWGPLSSSLYPPDEPTLPSRIHLRRAIGGPIGSLLAGLLAAIPVFLLPSGSAAWWVALFFCLDNLLTFGLGSFLPLGFTDGSTILNNLRSTP
jgi:hypothetical protein